MTDRVLLLAAGQSSRMRGRDKLLEDVFGQPLLRRQAIMALGLGWPVHVALPPEPHGRYDALKDLDVLPVPVAEAREGMGGTLRAAIRELPDDTTAVLLLLADLPDITLEDLHRLAAAREAEPEAAILRGATVRGEAGHPILFKKETLPAFRDVSGDDGGKAVLRRFAHRIRLVPLPGERARRDLDTPEDWQRWRADQSQQ